MDGFLTVGQPAAVTAVRAMLGSHVPHAILLSGPASVGKQALALDLAAGLLCTGATGADRPCRACRSCRMVEHRNHPDIHRIDPEGPGGQVRIGNSHHPEPGTVRWLASQLALLAVEAGGRLAIIRDAHRMNEDAQSALLKTLEEPPVGATIILCADDEERLLPTVRSRCARIRLGTVGARDVEQLLASRGLADAPTAARLARLAGGRPGLAVVYAMAPDAERIRGEITRTLLDLSSRGRAARLHAARDLMRRSAELAALLAAPAAVPSVDVPRRVRGGGAARRSPAATDEPGDATGPEIAGPGEASAQAAGAAGGRAPAAERRRALATLLDAWRELARDLALAQAGGAGEIRDVALLEELEGVARAWSPGAGAEALAGLLRAGELLDANVSPELLLDVLLVHWPGPALAA